MAEKNELQVSFSDVLTNKLTSVESALPKDFNRERFTQNALTVLNDNPSLLKINRNQLVQGLMRGAYMGLDFVNKEAYLIPYGNTVQYITSYKGDVKFAKKYSIRKISDVYAKVVREGDQFDELIIDGRASINFKPIPFNTKDIIGVFAVVLYSDGGLDYETMSVKEVQNVRNSYSKASRSKAWQNSFDEMAKKTVLHRLCKHIECDFESEEARKEWENASGMDFTEVKAERSGEVVDVFSSEPKEETTEFDSEGVVIDV